MHETAATSVAARPASSIKIGMPLYPFVEMAIPTGLKGAEKRLLDASFRMKNDQLDRLWTHCHMIRKVEGNGVAFSQVVFRRAAVQGIAKGLAWLWALSSWRSFSRYRKNKSNAENHLL